MKVRVFLPSGAEDYSYDGCDYEFEVLPRVGETIRFTDYRQADYVVASISYIQVGDSFLAAVYARDPDQDEVDAWVASYQPSRP